MHEFMQFVHNHWGLWLAFVVILLLIIAYEIKLLLAGSIRLSPQDAVNYMNHDKAVVVDLRDQSAFANGHIIDAILIPQADLEQHMNKLNKHKTKAILLYCQNGQQSFQIANKLNKLGFNHVRILAGGMNAWREAKLPINKGKQK